VKETDYIDPSCPFDVSEFRKTPSIPESEDRVDVLDTLKRVDNLYAQMRYEEAENLLEDKLAKAVQFGDKAGELGLLSELIGVYRKSREREKGLDACHRAFDLIKEMGLEGTSTAGTIWINGATTMRAFGHSEEGLPYFYMASRAYSDTIAADDYRFAGLYNNLGSCLEDLNRNEEAMKYYKMALNIVKQNPLSELDAAITWLSMAELYDKMDPRQDDMVENCVDQCMDIFNKESIPRDEYYAFHAMNCSKGLRSLGYFKDAKVLERRAEEIKSEIS